MDELRAPTGAPGGGAAAAVAGSMGCALFQMVAGVTLSLPRFTQGREELEKVRVASEQLHMELLSLASEDAQAYKRVEAAFKMPKVTSGEKAARRKTLQEAFVGATETPLRTLDACCQAMALLPVLLQYGNPNAITDVAVGFLMLEAALCGAAMNAEINLGSIRNEAFKVATTAKFETARNHAAEHRLLLTEALEKAGLNLLK